MAEALGIAASSIAIAQISSQVGGAILKLRGLLNEVKDVPDDIDFLMKLLECLEPMVWQTERCFYDTETALPPTVWDDQAAKHSTRLCGVVLKELTTMVHELSLQINHPKKVNRKIAAVKVVLKKDVIEKLEKRLEAVIDILKVAQGNYTIALMTQNPEIIIRKLQEHPARLQLGHLHAPPQPTQELPDDHHQEHTSQPKNFRFNPASREWRFRSMPLSPFGRFTKIPETSSIVIQLPSWLCQRSWEFQTFKAYGNWQVSLRSYCIRPFESEVFCAVKDGSPEDLQRMFDMRLASPFDCENDRGRSLMHLAAYSEDPTMVPYLLSLGLDLLAKDNDGLSALELIIWNMDSNNDKTLLEIPIVTESIIVTRETEGADIEHSCKCNPSYCSNLEIYTLLQTYQCPSHANTSIESRLDKALSRIYDPKVFETALEPEWTTDLDELCRITTSHGVSLFASLVNRLTMRYYMRAYLHGICCTTAAGDISLWTRLAKRAKNHCRGTNQWFEIVAKVFSRTLGGGVTYDQPGVTSLSALLSQWIPFSNRRFHYHVCPNCILFMLRRWLSSIKEVGVNLVKYGRAETKLLQKELAAGGHQFSQGRISEPVDWKMVQLYWLGFKYGPEPEDWYLYWREPTDEFAGDFWSLIEDPPPLIPGAWDYTFDE